jgi:hypothetical protein
MNLDYVWIGWCKEGNSDKIWVLMALERYQLGSGIKRYATIWGRRGRKLQSKIFQDDNAHRMISAKYHKGYIFIDKQKLDTVYPDFEQDLEQAAFWALLKG